MNCPKCGSSKVTAFPVNEVKSKRKRGLIYWLFIGWWLEPLLWMFLTIPRLMLALFGHNRKIVSVTVTYGVCQDCGHRWKIGE